MADAAPVLTSINAISNFLLGYAGTLAALGALTVALIEAWKKLLSSQAKFHRASVLRWFQNEQMEKTATHYRTQASPERPADGWPAYDHGRAYDQLLQLTTGVGSTGAQQKQRYDDSVAMDGKGAFHRSIEFALFELEVDRLMGQIQDAADVALNNPKLYPDLFQFLTRSAQPEDITNWVAEVGTLVSSTTVSDQQRKEIADRYTRVKQAVRRHLDSFQIVTALRWREWNQLAAVIVGAILLLLAQFVALGYAEGAVWKWSAMATQLSEHPFLWLKIPLVSVFGGMLAPVAKDLVDALRKVKTSV